MLISKRHKFIFFHIPKVAGSSVTRALRKHSDYPIERIYNYMIDYLGVIPRLNLYNMHITPIELQELMKNLSNFDEYYKFAFVRNPWDWHVSQFMYHKQKSNAYYHNEFKNMEFCNYVDWAIQEENIVSANARQKAFLSDNNGNLMVNFIGHFENLKRDFELIRNQIGVNSEIASVNPSKRKSNYRDYYNAELKSKIEEAFQEDINFFGYKF